MVLVQAKLEDSEVQVKELSRQVMALERAKVELEARNRQLESAAHGLTKELPGLHAAPGTPSQVCGCQHRIPTGQGGRRLLSAWHGSKTSLNRSCAPVGILLYLRSLNHLTCRAKQS